MSVNPLCFSGIGFNDFVNNLIFLTSIVSSSVFVLNKTPSTPIMSPISNSLTESSCSAKLSLEK